MTGTTKQVSYIVVGSKARLDRIQPYQLEEESECVFCPFLSSEELPALMDSAISSVNSKVIALIPAGAFPQKKARLQLHHFASNDHPFWGWYHFGNKFKGAMQTIGKVNTFLNKTPQLEQGIFFSKPLYFSVGGMGSASSNPFSELAKRFYLRLDPQNPLPSLTIRSKSLFT